MSEIDITGQRFGQLIAVAKAAPEKWLFRCDCGTEKIVWKTGVVTGRVKSCGCLHMERCKSGANRVRHGDARKGKVARLHSIWRGMLKRCNPNSKHYHTERYAARGIGVCPEWHDYLTFRAWALANGYCDVLTLEREDNDGPYSPSNCRWATFQEQCRNRRSTRLVTIDGTTRCVAEWLDMTGVSRSAFHARQKRGWPIKEALGL